MLSQNGDAILLVFLVKFQGSRTRDRFLTVTYSVYDFAHLALSYIAALRDHRVIHNCSIVHVARPWNVLGQATHSPLVTGSGPEWFLPSAKP